MTSSSSRQGVIKRRLATGGGIVVAGLLTTVIASAGTTSGPSPVRGAPPVAAEPEPELRVTARASQSRKTLPYATTSSPITPSRDGKVVWVVNPGRRHRLRHPHRHERRHRDGPGRRRAAERRGRPVQPLRVHRERRERHGDRHPDLEREPLELPRPLPRRAADRVGAVEHRGLAGRPPDLRVQQRTGHGVRDRRPATADHRPRRPAQQPLQRPRPRTPLPAARPRRHARGAAVCTSRASSPSPAPAASRPTTTASRASSAG